MEDWKGGWRCVIESMHLNIHAFNRCAGGSSMHALCCCKTLEPWQRGGRRIVWPKPRHVMSCHSASTSFSWRPHSTHTPVAHHSTIMPCPVMAPVGLVRRLLNYVISNLAWLVADIFGWRAALAVFPPMLRGKVAIVSGANAGLGLETTKALLQQGATVVMACRSLEHARTSREDILRDPRNAGPVGEPHKRLIPLQLDLEAFETIPRFVEDFRRLNLPGLHVLVNNAGVHLKPHARVSCETNRVMASNFIGHWWVTHLLLDDLRQSAPARIVNVASIAEQLGVLALYTAPLPIDDIRGRRLTDSGERPYTISKVMLLMFTRELAGRLEGTGVEVLAVHPGIADSTWYLKADNQAYLFSWLVHRARSLLGSWLGVGQPVRTGALSLIYASIAPELTGMTSSSTSHGLIERLSRALFGGRLAYFGPSYIFQNWNNTGRVLPLTPYCYSRSACRRLYEATAAEVQQLERELQQEGHKVTATVSAAPAG